jgi:RND family efflux transporter MFP subunit
LDNRAAASFNPSFQCLPVEIPKKHLQGVRGMNRTWVICGAFAALGWSLSAYYLRGRLVTPLPKADSSVVGVRRGDISEVISARGTVCGNCDLVVNCLAGGQIVKLPFAVGDSVKKGEVVCQLDPSQEQSAFDQAKIALSRAMHKLEETEQSAKLAVDDMQICIQQADDSIVSLRVKATNMQNKADRQSTLLSQSLSSQEEYETAQTEASEAGTEFHNAVLAKQELKDRSDMLKTEKAMDIEAIEEDVRKDEIEVKGHDDRLAATTMTAPMDGVISDLKTCLNSWIEQSGGEYSREPVMTISDLSRIFVNVSISEKKIGWVHVGKPAEIRADSYPGKSFAGTIVAVAPTGTNNNGAVTFGVKIEVMGADKLLLKPPMTAMARIIQETQADALLVPKLALERREQGAYVTLVGKDGRQQDRAVQVGISDEANDEIVGGLVTGDRVVVREPSAGLEVAQSVNE